MIKKTETTERLVVSRKEAVQLTGLSRATIDRAISRGDLRAKKYGSRRIILRSEVDRFLLALEDRSPAKAPRERQQR